MAILRCLLRGRAPEAFASILAEARALLAAATAMVRRYIHALAADFLLPPDMPVRWHMIRRLGPVMNALLTRLDKVARPWA